MQSNDPSHPGLFNFMSRLAAFVTSALERLAHVQRNIYAEKATLFQELIHIQPPQQAVNFQQQSEQIAAGNRINTITRRMGMLAGADLYTRIAETKLEEKLSDSQQVMELMRQLWAGTWESSWSQWFLGALERLRNAFAYVERVENSFDTVVERLAMR